MAIERVFLGLDRPALWAAADYLLARYRRAERADLAPATVVLPGRRAGRRLLEILVDRAASNRLLLTPPTIETVGRLPEELYVPQRPFANAVVQELVWAAVLRSLPAEQVRPVLPNLPAADDDARWLELGRLLRRQHVELAADGLSFHHVAQQGAEVEGFDEAERWQAMALIQDRYLRRLDELQLWDKQTARLVAIDKEECRTGQELIVAGTVDMNRATRRMLDQVSDRVTALIFAPPDWHDRFDEHGCLLAARWRDQTVSIDAQQLHVVGGPADQAARVVDCLSATEGAFRADQITIGVPDDKLVPDITRVLEAHALPSRWGPGQPLLESGPCRLLEVMGHYLQRGQYRDFAALLRQPDLEAWLLRRGMRGDWLSELDEYRTDHLPSRLNGQWLGSETPRQPLVAAHDAVRRLLQPLTAAPRTCQAWLEPILGVLQEVYGDALLDREAAGDRISMAALDQLRRALESYAQIPLELDPHVPAATLLRWTLDQLRGETVPPESPTDAIELLGWLELPLDDAALLIVTGMNEGFVPESTNSDLFLPNRLRSELGLLDNERRYARDAYALTVMLASRQSVQLIVGRRNRDGDPLIPSRLLFATDRETAARRAAQLFQPLAESAVRVDALPAAPGAQQAAAGASPAGLVVPRPRPLEQPITRLRVTSFRDYLACPYRFYLRHVLKLQPLDDRAEELSGAAFGSLAHEVLRRFGNCPERNTTDAETIRALLHTALDECTAQQFGGDAAAVVYVQVEQLRLRLDAFAKRQAAWAADGWQIEFTEISGRDQAGAELLVDGQPMVLSGRIDRIDLHPPTGRRAVFDYKTSDTARAPRQVHQRQDQWVDLQLPLYRHLCRSLGLDGPLALGYILLPKAVHDAGFRLADWSEAELQQADEVAEAVIRAIRREEFWPPADPPPSFSEDFAAICQDGIWK